MVRISNLACSHNLPSLIACRFCSNQPGRALILHVNKPKMLLLFLECNTYQVLDTSDRRTTNTRGCFKCDNNLIPGWYRFQDDAGTRMPTTCPAKNTCDTCAPGWLNGAHPTAAEGKVTRQVCFHWGSNCCTWSVNIEVKNCGSHYVYNLPVSPACSLRYCSTD